MKLTKNTLKRIIKEEIQIVLAEYVSPAEGSHMPEHELHKHYHRLRKLAQQFSRLEPALGFNNKGSIIQYKLENDPMYYLYLQKALSGVTLETDIEQMTDNELLQAMIAAADLALVHDPGIRGYVS